VKINQIIWIQIASLDEEENKKQYKSRIADMNETSFAIEIPLDPSSGKLKRLDPRDQLSVSFVTEDGVKQFFETEMLERGKDGIHLYYLRRPEPDAITRIQRRSFLRVPARLEIACRLGSNLSFIALTEDVGGGGVSIICDDHLPIKNNDILSCWLLLPFRNGQIEHVPFHAEVMRTKRLEGRDKQQLMMRFANIANAEQQKVIRYCFERQLENRKL